MALTFQEKLKPWADNPLLFALAGSRTRPEQNDQTGEPLPKILILRLTKARVHRTGQTNKDRMDFTTLYRRHLNRVYRFVQIQVANQGVAQELVAQTWAVKNYLTVY